MYEHIPQTCRSADLRRQRKDLVALPILFSRTFSPSLAKLLIPSFSNYTGSFPRSPTPSSLAVRTLRRALFLLALCKRKYSIRTLNSITAFLINPKYLLPKEERAPAFVSSSPALHPPAPAPSPDFFLRTSRISFGLARPRVE